MNVRELITGALYLSGVVARGAETTDGQEIKDALTLLNDILGERNSTGRFLPYYDIQNFNAVIGQEEYFVDNLVEIETLTVTLQDVRFSMRWVSRDEYFGGSRVNNIKSLPFSYHAERGINKETFVPGMRIWTYWEASQDDYIFEVVGRFSLDSVSLDTVISDKLERFYLSYLKYKLAHRFCHFMGYGFDPDKMMELNKLQDQCNDVSPVDTTLKIENPFGSRWPFNWGDVNIGRGWRP